MGCDVVFLKFEAARAADDALQIIETREKSMDSDKNHSFCVGTCIVLFVIPEKLIFKSSLERFNETFTKNRVFANKIKNSQISSVFRKYMKKPANIVQNPKIKIEYEKRHSQK